MKRLLKVVGLAVVGVAALSGILVLGARFVFGPLGPIPGPELSGSLVTGPVVDWSFVDDVKVIQVETDPQQPYSVSTWLTRLEQHIYVFAGDETSPWVRNIAEDPRVRIRIEGRIYERRAVRVDDLETLRAFLTRLREKYEDDPAFDPEFWQRVWDSGDLVLFRMDSRGER